jgi:uncharacterized protein YjbJ (UPF0337 family)
LIVNRAGPVAPRRADSSIDTTLEQVMNKDQVKGEIKQVKGNIKEAAGKVLGDKTMENKGKIQNAVGQVQKGYGDLKEDIKK